MCSEANSFLSCEPHNYALLVLSKSFSDLVCSAKLGQNFISWFTTPEGTFAIPRHHVAPGSRQWPEVWRDLFGFLRH